MLPSFQKDILAMGQLSFHLETLEATFIESFELSLCRQKEFVYGLKLSRLRRKRARNQLCALFLQPIKEAIIFDVLQSYINHGFLVLRHLRTIFSNRSWPKVFSGKAVF